MKLTKVVSKKSERVGYRGRYVDPLTKKRKKHTEWFCERRQAEAAWKQFLENVEARGLNLPDNSGWRMSYEKLIQRFLSEAPISTDSRREALKRHLDRNLLGIEVGADFSQKGKLAAASVKLAKQDGDVFVIKWVQQTLKQVSAWAASAGIFPYDPLASWKLLRRSSEAAKKRMYFPDEMRDIVAASDELDGYLARPFPFGILIVALLVTGNRPGAVFRARIGDFTGDRIILPPGIGKKRNGKATVTPELATEVRRYLALRGNPGPDQPLFVTHRGQPIDKRNIQDDFRLAATLAFVQRNWPVGAPSIVKPMEVALGGGSGDSQPETARLRRPKAYYRRKDQSARRQTRNDEARCGRADAEGSCRSEGQAHVRAPAHPHHVVEVVPCRSRRSQGAGRPRAARRGRQALFRCDFGGRQ